MQPTAQGLSRRQARAFAKELEGKSELELVKIGAQRFAEIPMSEYKRVGDELARQAWAEDACGYPTAANTRRAAQLLAFAFAFKCQRGH